MLIAITGNIGCGKSTFASFIEQMGYPVIYADKIGHQLYGLKSVRQQIVKRYGKAVFTGNKIDRIKLKAIVFRDPASLVDLNRIMFPLIVKKISGLSTALTKKHKLVFVEAALALEFKKIDYDLVVLVSCKRSLQFSRTLTKGKYTKEEVINIIKSQWSQSRKRSLADIEIKNNTSTQELKSKAQRLIRRLE